MTRFLVAVLLLSAVVVAGGCNSAMMKESSEQISQQGGWLSDALGFNVAYMGGLYGDTTRSNASRWEIAADMDQAWKELSEELGPLPPVKFDEVVAEPQGSVDMPSKLPVVSPPKETEVERLPNNPVVIIRRPDGGVTVTNKPNEEDNK